MSTQELTTIVHDLKELRIMAHMEEQAIDTLITTDVKITWKQVTSTRLDTTALKKELPDIAAQYTRQTTSRRFCVQ